VGLSKSSPSLDAGRNRLFYIRDDSVFSVELDDKQQSEREVCKIPPGWYSAFTHVSPDGKTLCVPCTDPRAFVDKVNDQWEQMRKVPGRMEREGLITRIYLIDVASGRAEVAAEVPFWVTHVQFDPLGSGRIVFNREGFLEGTGHPPPNRIWCLEPRGTFRPLSQEPEGEWRAHENWSPTGEGIVYHGGRQGRPFLAMRTWQGELLSEVPMDGLDFMHATATIDGKRLLVDQKDGFISIVDLKAAGTDRVKHICRHDSSSKDQDAHVHPITTPNGKSLIFTSDRQGNCNVYEVKLPA
jgi:Tol biopolymer transport system component